MKTMKKMFAMAVVAVVGLAGCQQELVDPDAVESDALKVYATIEEADDTRTSLSDREVYWTSGDRIAVFMKNTLRKRFDISSESVGTKDGTFLYDSDYIASGESVAISNNLAYYPFAEVTCTPGGGSYSLENLSLPSTQNYSPASFGQGAFPMVAVTADTDDLDFAFRNLCGVLVFQLKGSGTVRSITVEGNSDEILSGKATVTASFGKNPEISLLPDGSKTVTLDCGETGVALQNDTPTSFYIVLPPVAFDNGFTVTVTDVAGATKEYSTTKKNAILRSGILRMPEKEYVGERVPQEGDYIDEYGINHGQGVKIGETIWAPVNCGYHATDFKYGKLYQWGRKYGQGYDGDVYDCEGNYQSYWLDASVPEIIAGSVSLANGQSKLNENKFYYDASIFYDWCSSMNDNLWNSGTEENPVKTEYDPCPEGWRVPTYAELDELNNNYSSWVADENRQPGYWFSGANSYAETEYEIFFPAAGCRDLIVNTSSRGNVGFYWSSRPNSFYYHAYCLQFDSSHVSEGASSSRAFGYSVRCVQDNSELISVECLTLSKTSSSLLVGALETLTTTITPSNANHQSAYWWSDDPKVATVDQRGNVTAASAGTTTIYAMAGMQVVTCEVIVSPVSQLVDYVDEYGVNHGRGIVVGATIWAPVNCGYHENDFKYGKLYQWGRKYGQGYDGGVYDGEGDYQSYWLDASVPEIIAGPVSLANGQSKVNENKFYYDASILYDWCSSMDDNLWNSGTEESPVKTEYDPCPEGWRVPTYAELDELNNNYSSWTTNENGRFGYWLSGVALYAEAVPQVFFPAAGYRDDNGQARSRGTNGYYWSSKWSHSDYAYSLYFYNRTVDIYCGLRACGYSVRCVQE